MAEALATVKARGERFSEPELHRLPGELHWRAGRRHGPEGRRRALDEAEAGFSRALNARRLRTKSFDLRAAASLCALWQQTGRHQTAQRLLSQTYRWFTEGFDMPDLKGGVPAAQTRDVSILAGRALPRTLPNGWSRVARFENFLAHESGADGEEVSDFLFLLLWHDRCVDVRRSIPSLTNPIRRRCV